MPIALVRTRPIGTIPSDHRACESLGSWAFRLQKANAISSMGAIGTNAGVKIHKLIDVPTDPESTACAWARVSGRSAEEIAPMWLCLEGGPTSGRGRQNVMRAWALAEKACTYANFRSRHVVCPDCLAQDAVPYWRRSWRLCTTTICDVHRRFMLERCPHCHCTFAAPRPILLPLSHCSGCGFDLRNSAPDVASFHGRLLRETLHSIYRRFAEEEWPLRALPCRALRRLLNLACAGRANVASMEALARQRVETGLGLYTHNRHGEQFIRQTIEVRSRAVLLLEDFAARRPTDFERLVNREACWIGVADWLAEFHSLCATGDPVHRSAESRYENATA
ncbi:TniQ family protein [Neorhizobium sp. SHOUNA12B]|uniref:TniQ family protein n=1 Tax=Neorhizobium sp. SHOUNA12B TaxID=2908928 RepID=UPI0025E2238C|nr:TniQ family protein [Neorhizobium sp. SHOUNA12B]MCJ9671444.1 TniQ family protein [Neorhizobium sp. SHOUNA12B]